MDFYVENHKFFSCFHFVNVLSFSLDEHVFCSVYVKKNFFTYVCSIFCSQTVPNIQSKPAHMRYLNADSTTVWVFRFSDRCGDIDFVVMWLISLTIHCLIISFFKMTSKQLFSQYSHFHSLNGLSGVLPNGITLTLDRNW